MEQLPLTVEALIEALDKSYPERCPDPSWSDKEIWMKAGERRLVRRLLVLLESQNTSGTIPNVLTR